MVTFELSMGGYDVKVNGKPFGCLSKDRGFFIDSTMIKDFMEIQMICSASLTKPKMLKQLAGSQSKD